MLTDGGKCAVCLREDRGLSNGIRLSEPWLYLLQEIFNRESFTAKDRISDSVR